MIDAIQYSNPARWSASYREPPRSTIGIAAVQTAIEHDENIRLKKLGDSPRVLFNLPELEVSGLALVTSIDDCPPIACGEGSLVTARFVTREVHVVASVDVLGADGTLETITGTTIHPVWSVDRQEWVPLAELGQGETLQGLDAPYRVPGTDLGHLFASIRPGSPPGAWHRFGAPVC